MYWTPQISFCPIDASGKCHISPLCFFCFVHFKSPINRGVLVFWFRAQLNLTWTIPFFRRRKQNMPTARRWNDYSIYVFSIERSFDIVFQNALWNANKHIMFLYWLTTLNKTNHWIIPQTETHKNSTHYVVPPVGGSRTPGHVMQPFFFQRRSGALLYGVHAEKDGQAPVHETWCKRQRQKRPKINSSRRARSVPKCRFVDHKAYFQSGLARVIVCD